MNAIQKKCLGYSILICLVVLVLVGVYTYVGLPPLLIGLGIGMFIVLVYVGTYLVNHDDGDL